MTPRNSFNLRHHSTMHNQTSHTPTAIDFPLKLAYKQLHEQHFG
jgi:hypothetical protein